MGVTNACGIWLDRAMFFDFDNTASFRGNTLETTKVSNADGTTGYIEIIKNSSTGTEYAKRVTTKGLDGTYTTVTTCADLDINVTSVLIKDENGKYIEVVT